MARPIAASSLTLRDHFSIDTVPESLWDDMKKVFQDYYYQVAGLPKYISTAPMKIGEAMVKTLDKVRVTKYIPFHHDQAFLFSFFTGGDFERDFAHRTRASIHHM